MNPKMLQAQTKALFKAIEPPSKHEVRGSIGLLLKSITEQYDSSGDVFFSVHGPQTDGKAEWLHGAMYEISDGCYSVTLDRGVSKYVDNVLFISPIDTNTSIECSWESAVPDYVDDLQLAIENRLTKSVPDSELAFKADFQRIHDTLKSIFQLDDLYFSIQS